MTNTENVERWVDALRSGEFKQGKHRLRTVNADGPDEFCCLGVACEISGVVEFRQKPGSEGSMLPASWRYEDASGSGNGTLLPWAVMEWLGFSKANPAVEYQGRSGGVQLAELNDARGLSFNEIADLIEAQYLTSRRAA